MTLEELKALLLAKAQMHYESVVFRRHRLNEVLIAIVLGGAELDALRAELQKAKTDYAAVVAAIDTIENTDILDKFKTDTNSKMGGFIESNVKSPMTTDQSVNLARAVQYAKTEVDARVAVSIEV